MTTGYGSFLSYDRLRVATSVTFLAPFLRLLRFVSLVAVLSLPLPLCSRLSCFYLSPQATAVYL